MSFIACFIVELLIPILGWAFWMAVKRFPPAFAGVTFVGQLLGAFLLDYCGQAVDWPMAGLGVLCLIFYTGLLGMLIIKLWHGTWGVFCDYAASIVD